MSESTGPYLGVGIKTGIRKLSARWFHIGKVSDASFRGLLTRKIIEFVSCGPKARSPFRSHFLFGYFRTCPSGTGTATLSTRNGVWGIPSLSEVRLRTAND